MLTYSPFNRAARRLLKVRSIACTLASLGHIPIEEGDDLPAGAGRIGAEGGGAGPTCDALPDRPLDGAGIVGVCPQVQAVSGLKEVTEVPVVIPLATAQSTAS